MKNILIASAIFGILVGVLVWADYRDKQLMQVMDKYDQCVKRETGMTAMQFYQATGEKLDCEK